MDTNEYIILCVLITGFKMLFVNCYRSTDFEVHRNWLAITYSLPINDWYVNSESIWTLDYPPLFAWFEYILSHLANLFDRQMLVVSNLNYDSNETVIFQRLSVIITDFIYFYSVWRVSKECIQEAPTTNENKPRTKSFIDPFNFLYEPRTKFAVLMLANYGLLIVDHIHFQYNGFLYGILFLSVSYIIERRFTAAALTFSLLLNLKHIFLYIAPVYFIYLLRHCLVHSPQRFLLVRFFTRIISIGAPVIVVFTLSFGPFIYIGQLRQVLSRLFPFQRGLTHAYWAPNVWALYNFGDKVLNKITRRNIPSDTKFTLSSGLAQDIEHEFLPSIKPIVCFAITIFFIIPILWRLWRSGYNGPKFVEVLTMIAFTSFMFGYHVHEKAITMVILPLTLCAFMSRPYVKYFLLLSTVGHYSLFPLLFTNAEYPIKALLFITYTSHSFNILGNEETHNVNLFEVSYLSVMIPLESYCSFIHPYTRLAHYEFVPLMLVSVYTAFGILYCYIRMYILCLDVPIKTRLKNE